MRKIYGIPVATPTNPEKFGGGGTDNVMRVTVTEELVDYEYTCSHSADEIHEAVQSGKTAVLVWDDYIYSLMLSTETRAVFGYIDTEERCFSCFTIYDNAKIAYLSVVDYPNYDAGQLELGSEPTQRNHAVNKAYVDNAVKGKAYELIETITIDQDVESTVRTQEPNGTPYKFERVFIQLEGTPTTTMSGDVYAYCGSQRVAGGYKYFAGGKTTYLSIEMWQDCGYWRSQSTSGSQNTSSYGYAQPGGSFYTLKNPVSQYGYIDKINLYLLPIGCIAKIWGVRADA